MEEDEEDLPVFGQGIENLEAGGKYPDVHFMPYFRWLMTYKMTKKKIITSKTQMH